MGGIRCKVIIDYSNYAAEATALASLAGDPKHGFGKLAAEAAASAKAAYGGWVAGRRVRRFASGRRLCAHGAMCSTGPVTKVTDTNDPNRWIATMRRWRDEDLAFYQAFAAGYSG